MADRTTDERLARLAMVIDAYGANRRRWPAGMAEGNADLLSAEPAAQRMLDEAAALDRMLAAADADRGPAAGQARLAALSARIVVAAGQDARPTAEIIRLADRGRAVPRPLKRADWRAAALLAASLLSGLYIGGQGLGDEWLNQASETIGLGPLVDALPMAVDAGATAGEDEAL